MNSHKQYLAETEPLIYQRLQSTTRILWIASLIVFLSSVGRCYSLYLDEGIGSARLAHQIVSSILFFPYILAMLYAEKTVRSNARLGTQITLISTFWMLSIQLILNGDQAAHAVMAVPVLMILAGFLTNSRITLLVTLSIVGLITLLTLAEYVGYSAFNPDSHGYFGLRSFVYIVITLFIAYSLIKVVVHDFFVIQEGLREQKKNAEYIANHDPLTGLYNRYYAEHAADNFFSQARPGEQGVVLFLDIDNFKTFNTRFGHEGGDKVLKIIAQRLQKITTDKHTVACRMGGDEFIILALCSAGSARSLSRKILAVVAEPFELYRETMQLTCSIGISNFNQYSTFKALYRQADTAMHRAKYTGKNIQVEHDQAFSDAELERANILSNLKQALPRNEFKLCYQPQIDLATGNVIGMEALIRWEMAGRELPPGKFIELAEQNGMIHAISDWVIRKACQDCKQLHDLGYDHLYVAVNISAVYLERNNLVQTVRNSLAETGLPAHALELELTESALFQQGGEGGYEQLRQTRELGVELSIDDFGTGYSNLQYLGQLDIQRLKIDKSFVMQLAEASEKARDLIAAIVDIANRFRLTTVVEGVESAEVASVVHAMKCDIGQGYFWSKPITFSALQDLLGRTQVYPEATAKL